VTASVTVVIPTIGEPSLVAALEALARQARSPDEIIVVGQHDAALHVRFPRVTFIDTRDCVWPAAARNQAICAAQGEVLALTDADCVPAEFWLETLLRALDDGADVVGGGVAFAGADVWAQADNVSMLHSFYAAHPHGRRRFLPTLNLAVRRKVIDVVGLMDETLRACQDTDWTIRMQRAGYELCFEPAATVDHAPPRPRWRDVSRHCRLQGYWSIVLRSRYPEVFGMPRMRLPAAAVRLAAPLLAAWVAARIYINPRLWRFLPLLPVVAASKIMFCLGAAAAIDEDQWVRKTGPSSQFLGH